MMMMIIMIIINNIHYPQPILNIVMIRVMKILIGRMMKIMKMVMILSFLHKKIMKQQSDPNGGSGWFRFDLYVLANNTVQLMDRVIKFDL